MAVTALVGVEQRDRRNRFLFRHPKTMLVMLKQPNICLPVNNSTQQATLSHETGIFSWQTVLAVVLNLKNRLPKPWQDVIPIEKATTNVAQKEINAHLCSATSTYRHCKRAGQEKIESIGSSIIIRSYISGICGCCNFGLYRTAFLFNSSKYLLAELI